MKRSLFVVASLLLFAGCVVEPEPDYRRPVVVRPNGPTQVNQQQNIQNQNIDSRTHIDSKTTNKVNSTTTINNNITTNHPQGSTPAASQSADPTVEKFDKDGNPNYDENGNYIGGHGVGTMVDNPDAPSAEAGENPTPEPEPAAEPAPAPEPEPMAEPAPEPEPEPAAPQPDEGPIGASDAESDSGE